MFKYIWKDVDSMKSQATMSLSVEVVSQIVKEMKDGQLKDCLKVYLDATMKVHDVDEELYEKMIQAEDDVDNLLIDYYDEVYNDATIMPVLIGLMRKAKDARNKFFNKKEELEKGC
jgi:hypothetical protein